MTRLTPLPALALASLLFLAGPAGAAPQEPSIGTFTQENQDRILAQDRERGEHDPIDCDSSLDQLDEYTRMQNEGLLPASDDNDTAHYKRGTTLVIHIFINHNGGTWTEAERDDAGAKARVAKDYYLDRAPAAANVRFDFEGSEAYWYYEATVNYTIGFSGMNDAVVDDVLAALGFVDADGDGSRVDDMTLYLQNWDGGWDNVLACFQPDVDGRAWASYGTARTYLYRNSGSAVWAHEWGHLYGSCDEYVEGGQCNGGIDCGPCQSWYLDSVVDNGNCQLGSCPTDVDCLMINNTFNNICDYTVDHWGWVDSNNDGLLDTTKRRVMGNTFANIYPLYHNGWFYWNNVDHGMSISQSWTSWAVVGLRSPAAADYDLYLFGDNNHNNQYASSAYGGSTIDFVVGDYNHSRLGDENIEVRRHSGTTDWYNLTWESGTGMLYADGLERAGTWNDYNVVRVWDVPLFAGEIVTFRLDPSAGVDLGMALFKSNGGPYWAGRSGAQWSRDAVGADGVETYTYTVPADDVYGLVVWANTSVGGTFTIQIGPTPVTLAEETPFNSAWDLRLFNYDPNSFYWAFVGTRPQPDTGVRLALFEDANYTVELERSQEYGNGAMEFFAVDYNPSYSRDHLRVIRNAGAGTHRTEWEQDPEIISGALSSQNWVSPHLGKVWDCYLTSGATYFFREYHNFATPLDTGIYLFSSADGDRYKRRNDYAGAANFRPPGDGGEWFSYTAPANDWYGFIQIVNDESEGSYSVWMGPRRTMSEDVVITQSEEILWGSTTLTAPYWHVFATRPSPGDQASVWLYGDDAYTITTLAVSDQSNNPVTYVVGDYNHNPTGVVYPRFRRGSGSGSIDCEWEGGSEQLAYTPNGYNVYNYNWPAGDVAEIYDIFANPDDEIQFVVEDLSGNLDFGIAFFTSGGAPFYGNRDHAVATADENGIGGTETITVTAVRGDWYGFLIYNKNDNGGNFRITVLDPAVASAEVASERTFALRSLSANPFRDGATLEYSLPSEGIAELAIYDVGGREVRSLVAGDRPAGTHSVRWDGSDDSGASVAAGLYFAKLQTQERETRIKLIRSR